MAARLIVVVIRLYQRLVSPLLGPRCRFHPTCSEYALRAIEMNGLVRGGFQALGRIVRCGPWHPGGVDHPRPARRGRRSAEASLG
jgi:hypothetical protein